MPPLEEEGYIVLHMSVGWSTRWFPDDNSRTLWPRIMKLHRFIDLEIVKWFPDDNSRTLTPRIMKLHRYIDDDSQMTSIDFQVTKSKVKVTVTRNRKMVSG
jgi:hypothetical protein